VDLNGILWKAWIGFSNISREGFFLLTFLRGFCKILSEGFFLLTFLRAFLQFFAVFLRFFGFSWARYDLLSVMRGGAGFAKVCGSLGWLLLGQPRKLRVRVKRALNPHDFFVHTGPLDKRGGRHPALQVQATCPGSCP
jgi:hypothetical protein